MNDCKILITGQGQDTLLAACVDDHPVYLARARAKSGGGIFVGRVENYIRNLKAAFVRFDDREIGYLPLDEVPQDALLNRAYKRGEDLKTGDLLCVQMRHAAHATKQAKLTGYLTLHGRYAVLGLEKTGVGCSRALPAETRNTLTAALKQRLKDAVSEDPADTETGLPADFSKHFGVILRTESGALLDRALSDSAGREEAVRTVADAVFADVCALFHQMTVLVREAKARPAGHALYRPDADAELHERLLRLFHYLGRACPDAPVEIVCASDALYESASQAACTSRETVSVRVNKDLDNLYGIRSVTEALSHRVVWLKSGAYLVIEDTEAMTVVDVNSGKYTAKKDDDFVKVNLEAAEEVMRQIRLRDLSGIIVVDFINMREGASYALLKERLAFLASLDPVHTHFHDITALGLAEITRTAH